jgi:hypothetical protein
MTKPGYQTEPRELVGAIWERGHIRPWELFRIVSWKSAKGVALLSLNSEDEIEEWTADALRLLKGWRGPADLLAEIPSIEWDSWESLAGDVIGADKNHGGPSGLLRISGVGYPVATAILGFLAPNLFPVMDKWGVETIFDPGSSKKRWHHKRAYRAYAHELVETKCAELLAIPSLRERDKFVMEVSMNGGMLVGYKPIPLPK